jgi:hypothetical protein
MLFVFQRCLPILWVGVVGWENVVDQTTGKNQHGFKQKKEVQVYSQLNSNP